MNNKINVYIRIDEGGTLPKYSSTQAAGCDLYATEDMIIRPGEIKLMPLNFVVSIEPEMEIQIRPRSGLSLKTKLRIPNSPATIDSDFKNTIGIIIENTYSIASLPYEVAVNPQLLLKLQHDYREIRLREYLKSQTDFDYSKFSTMDILNQIIYIDEEGNPYGTIYIKKGDRIAQMVFNEYKRANFIPHPNPEAIGEDRGGGFGSTGI